MNLFHSTDIEKFAEHCKDFLNNNEDRYNLIIAILNNILNKNILPKQVHCFAFDVNGTVNACALTTCDHNMVLSDMYEDQIEILADYVKLNKITFPGVVAPKQTALSFALKIDPDCQLTMSQGYFVLRDLKLPPITGQLIKAKPQHRDLLIQWVDAFIVESLHQDTLKLYHVENTVDRKLKLGTLFLLEVEGEFVAMAANAGESRHGARVSLVYTPPKHRKKGYGSQVTAFITQYYLEQGKQFTSLYTDLTNSTSNSIYKKLGYQLIYESAQYMVNFDEEG